MNIVGALFVLFVALKLTNTIAWSWWWVAAPLWGGFAVWVAIFAITFLLIELKRLGRK